MTYIAYFRAFGSLDAPYLLLVLFVIGTNRHPAMAQVAVERTFGNAKPLGNLVGAEPALSVQRLGRHGLFFGLHRETPGPPARATARSRRLQAGLGAFLNEVALKFRQ